MKSESTQKHEQKKSMPNKMAALPRLSKTQSSDSAIKKRVK